MKSFIVNSQNLTQIVGKWAASACILSITLFGMTSCHAWGDCEPDHKQNCSEKSAKAGAMTATLKVGRAICGVGKWGNLWLEADSTVLLPTIINPKDTMLTIMPIDTPNSPIIAEPLRWLQPYSVEKGINYLPKEGETVRIVYEVVQDDKAYDNVITCKAYMGRHVPVNILCIEPVNTK